MRMKACGRKRAGHSAGSGNWELAAGRAELDFITRSNEVVRSDLRGDDRFRLQNSDCRIQISNCRSRIAGLESPVSIANCTFGFNTQSPIWKAEICNLKSETCNLQSESAT